VTVQLYKWDGNYEMLIVATTIYGAQSHLQLGSTNMVFGCQLAAFRCVHYSHYWLKHLQTAKPLQSYMKTWLELNLTSAVVFGKLLIPTSSLRTKSTATTILHQPWLPPVILHAHINNELVVCSFTPESRQQKWTGGSICTGHGLHSEQECVNIFLGILVILNFFIGSGASRILRRGEYQGSTVVGPYGPWPKPAKEASLPKLPRWLK
jgi:hypothetical protein